MQDSQPPGFRYATYKLADGVSFLHLARVDPGEANLLPTLPAFRAFQQGIRSRCEVAPVVSHTKVVGAYQAGAS